MIIVCLKLPNCQLLLEQLTNANQLRRSKLNYFSESKLENENLDCCSFVVNFCFPIFFSANSLANVCVCANGFTYLIATDCHWLFPQLQIASKTHQQSLHFLCHRFNMALATHSLRHSSSLLTIRYKIASRKSNLVTGASQH